MILAIDREYVEQTRRAYVAALLRADAVGAQSVIDEAISGGMAVRTCYLDVLTPAMHELGVLWEQAKITVADEHLATAITQGVLATLAGRLPRIAPTAAARTRVAVVGCGPEDFHGLGARIVGDFLAAAGWRVLDLGAATPALAFASVARAHDAQLVAVSSSQPEHLEAVRAVRPALEKLDRPPVMAVGGHGYRDHSERAAVVGADLYADDPESLLARLSAALADRRFA